MSEVLQNDLCVEAMYHVTDETHNGEVETKLVKELADHNDKFDRQILKDEDDDCLVIDCGDSNLQDISFQNRIHP
eukprot:UN08682